MDKNWEVDSYLDTIADSRGRALSTLRELIHALVPGVQETMRYNMPTFELDGVLCSMAAQKHYMSLYLSVDLVELYKDDFRHLDVGRSCIRFSRIDDLPLDTIKQILIKTAELQSMPAIT